MNKLKSKLCQQDFKYNIGPEPSIEERYDVSTSVRGRGPYRLDTTNLNNGDNLPSFIPIAANLKNKKCVVVRNVEVVEAYVSGATSLKIKKGSFVYADMHIGNGTNGATVSAINRSDAKFDLLTITAFGENLAIITITLPVDPCIGQIIYICKMND
ncbi:MAG: head fiber protein [Dysgonomonas sp.]